MDKKLICKNVHYDNCVLREEIFNMFLLKNTLELSPNISYETLVELQKRIKYDENYLRLLEIAIELFIEKEKITPKIIKIPLLKECVINKIVLELTKPALKIVIRYIDSLGIERNKRLYWYDENQKENKVIIGLEKFIGKLRIHTAEAKILVYGDSDIKLKNYETLSLEKFFVKNDEKKLINLDHSYMSNLYLGEILILNNEYLVSGIRIMTDEPIRVFVKDIGRSTRLSKDELAELAEYIEIGEIKNNYLEFSKPYLTNEIKLKSKSGRSYIKNTKIFTKKLD
ncbi:MAG: hypothetical protein ACRDDH_01285 [Cetobacterium sp.]|uniref:hypothetical protein n=1 Tax=Cetobacterium sp. TaxID=2071632 RepID=UPI003EE425A7